MTNIAVVVLDTLRKDSFDQEFGWVPGVAFDNAWSTSHWTVPAHSSLFTGEYASKLGVYARSPYFSSQEPALAERLKQWDYRTRGFSANPQISAAFNFDRGFDELKGNWRTKHLNAENLFDWHSLTSSNGLVEAGLKGILKSIISDVNTVDSLALGFDNYMARSDSTLFYRGGGVMEAIHQLQEWDFDEREFLFLNLMDAHAPYRPPEEYRSVSQEDVDLVGTLNHILGQETVDGYLLKSAYHDSVTYLSKKYKQLFNLMNETFDVIITLSDHGELLGEHGMWGHGHGVYPELTKIPLVISPGHRVDRDGMTPLSIADLHDIILKFGNPESGGYITESEYESNQPKVCEYHGVTHQEERSALIEEFGQDAVKEFDQWLAGVVDDEMYYYETYKGKQKEGNGNEEQMEELLQNVKTEFQSKEVNSRSAPTEVSEHLKDLGYI